MMMTMMLDDVEDRGFKVCIWDSVLPRRSKEATKIPRAVVPHQTAKSYLWK